jgi:hypothetical protein
MDYLEPDEQLFVRQQICYWVLGRHCSFREMNYVWSALGAQAYFWA